MAKRVTKGNLWGFIQSRPYASVADIRRLFMMEVDGAAAVATNEGAYYIGLPQDTADIIRQLWQEGRIILDLNPDVKARVVQGVYPARIPMGRQPMRPVAAVGSAATNGSGGSGTPPAAVRPSEPVGPVGPEHSGANDAGVAAGKRRRRRKRRPGEGPELTSGAETHAETAGDAGAPRPAPPADPVESGRRA